MLFIDHIAGALRCILEPLRRGERFLIVSSTGLHLQLLGAKSIVRPVSILIRPIAFLWRSLPGGKAVAHLLASGASVIGLPGARVAGIVCNPTANVAFLIVHVVLEGRRWQLVPCCVAGALPFCAARVAIRARDHMAASLTDRCCSPPLLSSAAQACSPLPEKEEFPINSSGSPAWLRQLPALQ